MQALQVTGLVLAGGRGSRMGGVDKGLQPFRGRPLAQHALERLSPQVGALLVNANRHPERYQAWGAPVVADAMPQEFAGPLAGFLAGLLACRTPWLCTVPCDTPLFPEDLVRRLGEAAEREGADMAMACAQEEDGQWRAQPVLCLLKANLADSLQAFMQAGGRKIDAWTAQHRTALVRFDAPGDAAAFSNANTLDELRRLEEQTPP
jgi:molybdopterin-guanine dinucleotide biosynthesis protein A